MNMPRPRPRTADAAPRRRSFLKASSGLVAGAALLAACGGGPSSAPTSSSASSGVDLAAELKKPAELTFWTWVPGIEKEVALFTKKYPNIKVKVVNAGQGAAQYTKLRTALKAGTGAPDVVQVEFQYIPTFTVTNDLLDLAPYGANDVKDKFIDWTWSQVSKDGKVYAIPQDTGPMGVLYRKDLLEKAGIAVPTTWDEFAQAARTYRKKNPDSYLTNFPPTQGGVFAGLTWQAGAKPFAVDGQKVTVQLNDSAAKRVTDFWGPLIKEGVVSTDADFTDAWYQGLAKGKYASWITAAWGPTFLQGTAKDTAGKWVAAPLPQWSPGEKAAGNWGGSTTAATAKTKYPAAAAEFAKFLNSDPESAKLFATEQFFFPATKSALADPAVNGATSPFYGGQQVNKLFGEISGTVSKDFQWSPFQDYVYTSLSDTLGKAVTSKGDLTAALDDWQKSVQDYAKKQGFEVTGG